MDALVILGSCGGVIAAISAVVVIGRGIFRQVSATEDNTDALNKLSSEVKGLSQTSSGHETRLSVLEDRVMRRETSR